MTPGELCDIAVQLESALDPAEPAHEQITAMADAARAQFGGAVPSYGLHP